MCPEKHAMSQQRLAIITTEIGKLALKQAQAVHLRLLNNMSFGEIAKEMNCPYNTAKANYRHGLLKLREKLDNSGIV